MPAYRSFYQKLVALYPRAFKERFGESMQQTFDDLCRERGGHLTPGFITWMAAETLAGIVREHFIEFRKRGPMENARTNFALSALTGFLFILPFMILAFTFDVLGRLDTFRARNFIDYVVIFGFLWFGLTIIAAVLMPILRNIGAAADSAPEPAVSGNNAFKKFIRKPAPSAVIGSVLALPFLLLLSMLLLKIQPPAAIQYFVANAEPDEPNMYGSIVMISVHILAVVACFIARAPVMHTLRSGGSLFAHPFNLLIVTVILFIFGSFVLGLMMDQFPCWIGVPNCD